MKFVRDKKFKDKETVNEAGRYRIEEKSFFGKGERI